MSTQYSMYASVIANLEDNEGHQIISTQIVNSEYPINPLVLIYELKQMIPVNAELFSNIDFFSVEEGSHYNGGIAVHSSRFEYNHIYLKAQ